MAGFCFIRKFGLSQLSLTFAKLYCIRSLLWPWCGPQLGFFHFYRILAPSGVSVWLPKVEKQYRDFIVMKNKPSP